MDLERRQWKREREREREQEGGSKLLTIRISRRLTSGASFGASNVGAELLWGGGLVVAP